MENEAIIKWGLLLRKKILFNISSYKNDPHLMIALFSFAKIVRTSKSAIIKWNGSLNGTLLILCKNCMSQQRCDH